jgi:Ca-activated chloride channel family protein
MNQARKWPALLVPLLIIGASAGRAQQQPDETFRADTRLVVLHASVVDKGGRLVTNLPQSAFKIYENNVEQPLKTFRREDVPVTLALVVDNSGSMRNKRKQVESAALAAVKASNPRDEVTVINFNDEPFRDVDLTSDTKKMEEGLTRLDSRGGTAIRDAIGATIDYIKQKGKHQKKVLFVVTDGDDTASEIMSLEKLVQKAHDSEVLLYFIGLLSEEDKRAAKRAKRAMDALAKASGGTAVYPESLEEVERIALSVAQEIRNQYVLTYTPTNTNLDGSFRQIKVVASGPGRPTVRTRSGYYAVPEETKRSALAAK